MAIDQSQCRPASAKRHAWLAWREHHFDNRAAHTEIAKGCLNLIRALVLRSRDEPEGAFGSVEDDNPGRTVRIVHKLVQ